MYTVVRAVRQKKMAVVEMLKQETRVTVWTDCQKKGRCREMAVSGGSTVSAKAKVIKSYNEGALEKTIYQSVTQKEKSEDSR